MAFFTLKMQQTFSIYTEMSSLNFQLHSLWRAFSKVLFSKCCPSTLKSLARVFKFIHSGHAREHFQKDPFSKCFLSTLNANPAFSNLSTLKSVFKKFRFWLFLLDDFSRLVWWVGLTLRIKLHFQFYPA